MALTVLGPVSQAAKRMHIRQKSACTKLLVHLTDSSQDILDSKLITIDQGPKPGEKILTFGHPETHRLYQGHFRSAPESKNELAAYLIDQLLGRPARIPMSIEYTLGDESGVFSLKVQTYRPSEIRKLKSNPKEEWALIKIFDFLIGLTKRERHTIKPTPEGISLTEHSNAFSISSTSPEDLPERTIDELKTAWNWLPRDFKNQLENLDADALKDELDGILSNEKIDTAFKRAQFLIGLQ